MNNFKEFSSFYIPSYISWQNMFGKTYIINEATKDIITIKGKVSLIWNCLNQNLNYSKLIQHNDLQKIEIEYLEDVIMSFIDSDVLGVVS